MNIDVKQIEMHNGFVLFTNHETSDGKFLQLIDGSWWDTSGIYTYSENLVKIWMKHRKVYLKVSHTVG